MMDVKLVRFWAKSTDIIVSEGLECQFGVLSWARARAIPSFNAKNLKLEVTVIKTLNHPS
jgi:hypothetical protein